MEQSDRCNEALGYVTGESGVRDPARAAEIFRELADEGYVPRSRANEVAGKAAEGGHAAAMFRLAEIISGEGEDQVAARELFLKSAEAGFPAAFSPAGDMLFYGIGGPQIPEDAFGWYALASTEGDPVAMFKAGYMLENGVGTAADPDGAVELFRMSAEGGLPEGAFKMATLAHEGRIPGGSKECARWYSLCSEMGYPAADFNLATMYYEGDGVERDVEKAFALYSKVAETGDGDACMMVGRMYLEGIGTTQNTDEGLKMIGRAAAAGNQMALQFMDGIRRRQNTQMVRIDGTE